MPVDSVIDYIQMGTTKTGYTGLLCKGSNTRRIIVCHMGPSFCASVRPSYLRRLDLITTLLSDSIPSETV